MDEPDLSDNLRYLESRLHEQKTQVLARFAALDGDLESLLHALHALQRAGSPEPGGEAEPFATEHETERIRESGEEDAKPVGRVGANALSLSGLGLGGLSDDLTPTRQRFSIM